MTVCRTHNDPSPGPSCFTVTAEMSLQLCSYIYFLSFLLVLFASSITNIDSSHVLYIIAPKQDRVYARGHSKFVAPSARLVIGFDDEYDAEFVPPSTATPSRDARATRATPKKVVSGVVIASQSDEERSLTDTPSGSATQEERASGSFGVSWSEEASNSAEVPIPTTDT